MKYDLKDLETFINVAQLRSFARAAEKLEISKTHISTRINNLEKAVKISLLARTTRDVNLTNEGKKFLIYAKSIMEKVNELDDFIDKKKEIMGNLSIIIPPYFSRYHIVPYLEEFMERYPKLKLDITLTEDPINIIEQGYDLQIRIQKPEEENLEVEHLRTNHKIVCASPVYIKKHGFPKTPKDLLKHNCIVFGENKVWEFKHKKTGEIIRIPELLGNIKCNNGEIIKELTLSGIGITLKSSIDSEKEIKSGDIVVLLEDYDVLNFTSFYAVFPTAKYRSEKIKAFVNFFQNKLANS